MTSPRSASRLTICRQRPEKGPIKLMMGWISDITLATFDMKQALCCAIIETPGKGNSIRYLARVDFVPDSTTRMSQYLWFGTQESLEASSFPYGHTFVYCLLKGCVHTSAFFLKPTYFSCVCNGSAFKTVVCPCTTTEKLCQNISLRVCISETDYIPGLS